MSEVRQNFHEECEAAINKQINMELYASYVYLSMSYHFSRTDVALPGAHRYFLKASHDEREHAMRLMAYQNSRGGRLSLTDVKGPPSQDWGRLEEAMQQALALERDVNESLLALHALGARHEDPNLLDFLESHYLQEQVDSISEIASHLTNLRRNGEGVGEFLYDKELGHSDNEGKD